MKKLIQIIAVILFPAFAFAQLNLDEVIKPNEGEPINITSDSLVIKNNENVSIFEQNVHVTQGDMNLKADQMKVYSEYDEKTKKSKFKRIEASGHVDFQATEKSAQSDHADYDVKGGILILRDNVHLKDADSTLQGKVFEYNVKTGLSKISNSSMSSSSASQKSGDKPAAGTTTTTGSASGADQTSAPSGGRVKAVFTPGEDIKNFSMPMDAFEGVKGKDRKVEPEKEDNKPKE